MRTENRERGTAVGRGALTGLCAIVLAVLPTTALSESGAAIPEEFQPPPFDYQIEDRPDPFMPFITEKATSVTDMNEIVDDNSEPLTGMQLFEPGQLTLVALLQSGGENVAMVQDFTGKGYVISEGTLIGRRGVVTYIGVNSVTIEETARTRAGKKIVTRQVMTLKKEEGED